MSISKGFNPVPVTHPSNPLKCSWSKSLELVLSFSLANMQFHHDDRPLAIDFRDHCTDNPAGYN